MRKIPTIFLRDPDSNRRFVLNEPHPDCGWVFNGEGEATYKYNGTAVRILDGEVWQRREVKHGQEPPHTFDQEGDPDPVTGKRVGWVLADLEGDPAAKWLAEAFYAQHPLLDGTYELVGPKVQGNPHNWQHHQLIPHRKAGGRVFDEEAGYWAAPPTEFRALRQWLHEFANNGTYEAEGFEGIVWHHPDGRMAKIKLRDFPTPSEAP